MRKQWLVISKGLLWKISVGALATVSWTLIALMVVAVPIWIGSDYEVLAFLINSVGYRALVLIQTPVGGWLVRVLAITAVVIGIVVAAGWVYSVVTPKLAGWAFWIFIEVLVFTAAIQAVLNGGWWWLAPVGMSIFLAVGARQDGQGKPIPSGHPSTGRQGRL